ncbi:Defensin fusion [Medicago truncatula]|uniref:Defensin-like protein n=1 Tax=Medicago truncatula TaxID=3880 RepID=G7INH4_MEDTR|nr:Defensin fusion [Medicago truncatula]
MLKSVCFFAFLALVVAVQLTQVEGVCTNIVANCADEHVHCPSQCEAFGRGVKPIGSSCDFYNLCTCTYAHQVTGQFGVNQCEIGMGLCTDDCRNDCCYARCEIKYPKSGVGYCVQDYGLDYCSCTYRRR